MTAGNNKLIDWVPTFNTKLLKLEFYVKQSI